MKTYYNGQRKGMMYGGGANVRKPMMYGGMAAKKEKKMMYGGKVHGRGYNRAFGNRPAKTV